jgi:hypothetical protein
VDVHPARHDRPVTSGRPGEMDDERADRNFGDLLQELRVGQTGVQILFGFLLTMPIHSNASHGSTGSRKDCSSWTCPSAARRHSHAPLALPPSS